MYRERDYQHSILTLNCQCLKHTSDKTVIERHCIGTKHNIFFFFIKLKYLFYFTSNSLLSNEINFDVSMTAFFFFLIFQTISLPSCTNTQFKSNFYHILWCSFFITNIYLSFVRSLEQSPKSLNNYVYIFLNKSICC